MDHRGLVKRISNKTDVNEKDCEKVLYALEDILERELGSSKHIGGAVDKVYNLLGYFRDKKRDGNE